MSSVLIHSLKGLVLGHPRRVSGKNMADLPQLGEGAFLLIEDGLIRKTGLQNERPERADLIIDGSDRFALPGWVDSHTHLVFAGSREAEFVDRINGLSYQEIASRGGGILNSAARLAEMSEEALLRDARIRLNEVIRSGTGAIEIKSGYGLSTESELKILRVIRQLKAESPIPIRATFLGAHSVPATYKANREGYIRLIEEEMLPAIAAEGLAEYMDVFCEKVAFSVAETQRLIEAGYKAGLKPKIHVNQFYSMGGIPMACSCNAISVDHLEVISNEDIEALQHSNTIATLLPSAPFFLNDPYPNARALLDAGLAVALATDYNPGSTPSGRMGFVLSLACLKMKMLPAEAINAATINGAAALEWEDELGSIHPGKRANILLTEKIPSLDYLPYRFGSDQLSEVLVGGKLFPLSQKG
ncbi:MAG: imidazolonepropionase [Saprospiraceae bacterium]|nr:imidazolonepropionase [Saprospiraceae bacterium]